MKKNDLCRQANLITEYKMRQVLINGCWESPPSGTDIHDWLYEIIAVEIDELLCITRYIPRFESIQAVRKSPRSKAVPVKIVR